jgi:uncharacterized membrane protein
MDDLDQAFQAAERLRAKSHKASDDYAQRRQQDDRSLIAKLIVYAFVGLIGVVVLILAAALFYFKDWKPVEEAAKFLVAILGSVLLPVVTLVIGYYFGKEK